MVAFMSRLRNATKQEKTDTNLNYYRYLNRNQTQFLYDEPNAREYSESNRNSAVSKSYRFF